MEFAFLFRYAQLLFSAESRTSGMLLFYNFDPPMAHIGFQIPYYGAVHSSSYIILKAEAKVTKTLNPFKVKLENIKDAYRKYPRTDSAGNLWAPTLDSSGNKPSSEKSQDQEDRSSPTDPPKPSKEDIQRKIQKALLMKEHSGIDSILL